MKNLESMTRLIILALSIFFSANLFAMENDAVSRCEHVIESAEKSGTGNLVIESISIGKAQNLPILSLWGGNIPILTDSGAEVGLFGGHLSNKRISFLERDKKRMQSILISDTFTRDITEDSPYSVLKDKNIWDAILKSLKISSGKFDCHSIKRKKTGEADIEGYVRDLVLLSLKQVFLPRGSKGIVDVPSKDGFIVTRESGFVYYEKIDNMLIETFVYGSKKHDLQNFITTLQNMNKTKFESSIADIVLKTWKTNTINDWTLAKEKLTKLKVNEQLISSIDNQIDYLRKSVKFN